MNSNYLLVSLLVFLASFLITSIFEKRLIPILKRSAAQPIYSEGPVWHMKKSGTPTMGGLGFAFSIIITISVSCIFLYIRNEIYYAVSLALSLAYIVLNPKSPPIKINDIHSICVVDFDWLRKILIR